jgi:phage tail sheath protein FI
MPEYLAPAVYVEETSFRAKPIEGVGTSTTAFVGATRKGPIGDTPELITSVGDFERIYGGTTALGYGGAATVNYMAHAVRAYFDNGGSRLYVARTFQPRIVDGAEDDGRAESADLVASTTPPARAWFRARFPGAAGNGRIQVRLQVAPAARTSLDAALPGSMIRTGASTPARPAILRSTSAPPFRVQHGAILRLVVNGTTRNVTFEGTSAELVATAVAALPADVPLTAANNVLVVNINSGPDQRITLPTTTTPREQVLSAINQQIQGGFARLDATNKLVIGSDLRGRTSGVRVHQAPVLGFDFPEPTRAAAGGGNVDHLERVGIADLAALLEPFAVRVVLDSDTQALTLVSEEADGDQRLEVLAVAAPALSAHASLGLPAATPAQGSDGDPIVYYVKRGSSWVDAAGGALPPSAVTPGGVELVSFSIVATDADGIGRNYEDLAFDAEHPRYVGHVLAETPNRYADRLENLYALHTTGAVTGFALRDGLLGSLGATEHALADGNDGAAPLPERFREGLGRLEVLEDISIVAAPGASRLADAQAINNELITHVSGRRRYRIAVLDVPPDTTVGGARAVRSEIDSKYAAIYYPWVVVPNPDARPGDESRARELTVPPSGHVCGVYARNDIQRGVHKAPANEVVRGALRFETRVNMAEQEVLNVEGINALRSFPGRGHLVWGARVATSDLEWKYVNVRRYFNYVEASIDRGTQWVVFEPNGERLWARLRTTVSDFLYNEWRNGALLGTTPKEAFFVRCDRSTMTQADLDNGRLICEVGIAVIKPAEFVIFRIGQKTADARS